MVPISSLRRKVWFSHRWKAGSMTVVLVAVAGWVPCSTACLMFVPAGQMMILWLSLVNMSVVWLWFNSNYLQKENQLNDGKHIEGNWGHCGPDCPIADEGWVNEESASVKHQKWRQSVIQTPLLILNFLSCNFSPFQSIDPSQSHCNCKTCHIYSKIKDTYDIALQFFEWFTIFEASL